MRGFKLGIWTAQDFEQIALVVLWLVAVVVEGLLQ